MPPPCTVLAPCTCTPTCTIYQHDKYARALTGVSLAYSIASAEDGCASTKAAHIVPAARVIKDGLICVRVSQSNRAVAAATRVSFQRRPIANVRRDLGTVRFVASRIDLRFSSVAIGHMIS